MILQWGMARGILDKARRNDLSEITADKSFKGWDGVCVWV